MELFDLKETNGVKYLISQNTWDIYLLTDDNYKYFKFLFDKNGYIRKDEFYSTDGSVKQVEVEPYTKIGDRKIPNIKYVEMYAEPDTAFDGLIHVLLKNNLSNEDINRVFKEIKEVTECFYYGDDLYNDRDIIEFYSGVKSSIENDLDKFIY